jgi:hypothetical protein
MGLLSAGPQGRRPGRRPGRGQHQGVQHPGDRRLDVDRGRLQGDRPGRGQHGREDREGRLVGVRGAGPHPRQAACDARQEQARRRPPSSCSARRPRTSATRSTKLDPSKATDTIGKVGGAADKMAKTVGDSPSAALESFKRQAIVKLAEISGTFISFAMDNKAVFGRSPTPWAGSPSRSSPCQGRHDPGPPPSTVWSRPPRSATGTPMGVELGAAGQPDHVDRPRRHRPDRRHRHHRHEDHLVPDSLVDDLGRSADRVQRHASDWFKHRSAGSPACPGSSPAGSAAPRTAVGKKLTEMVTYVSGVPGRVCTALSGLAGRLTSRASAPPSSPCGTRPRPRPSGFVRWVAGIPGRVSKRRRRREEACCGRQGARTSSAACGTASSPWAAGSGTWSRTS